MDDLGQRSLASMLANAGMNLDRLRNPPVYVSPQALRTHDHVSWMYERLVRSIAKFEEDLDPDSEIGARLVTFGNEEVIHIENVGYWGPDLLIFYGKSSTGKPLQLLQHQSQVNVLLIAVPKEGLEPRRIGFDMVSKLEGENGKSA